MFSTLRSRVILPSADKLAVIAVASALTVQLVDAALQSTRDSIDSTTSIMASDKVSHQLIVGALRVAHDKERAGVGKRTSSEPCIAHKSNATRITDAELIAKATSQLNSRGYLVIPGVFTGSKLASCRRQAAELMTPNSDGVLVAKPGEGKDEAINREVLMKWVRPHDDTGNTASDAEAREIPGEAHQGGERGGLQSAIALVRSTPSFLEISTTSTYDRSHSHEVPNLCRLALMPGTGATYRPHRDATIYSVWELGVVGWLKARGYQRRVLTSILYLNKEDWSDIEHSKTRVGEKDGGGGDGGEGGGGGCLRLHPGAEASDKSGETSSGTHVDVRPSGGTLVIFDAKDVLHEVLPTWCDRLTITSWVVGDHRA